MQKLELSGLNVGIKATRGFAGMESIYALRTDVLAAIDISRLVGFVTLKPGEETQVAVSLPGVPLNADIKNLKAQIEIHAGSDSEKGTLQQTSTVQEGTQTPKEYKVDIELPAVPKSLTVRLDGGEVFWTSSTAVVEGTFDLPDFVEQVNTYLDKLPAGSREVALVFLIKSDGPGQVKISVDLESLAYSVIQTEAWPNPLDETVRVDRNLQLEFGSVERIELHSLASGDKSRLSLKRLTADIGGAFGVERLFTNVAPHDGREFATISGDYSLAQSFELSERIVGTNKPLHAAGVSALLEVEAKTELYVEVQADNGSVPSTKAALAKSNLTIEPEKKTTQWFLARFDQPVDLSLDTRYWIVVKGIQGKALLALGDPSEGYLETAVVNRGGQLWKAFSRRDPVVRNALIRLIYLPEIDNRSASVEIGIEGVRALQRFDPQQEPQTISLEPPATFKTEQPVLIIKSHAQGSLTLANVIQEYA
ncbi:MAG TPA: hypothetical protein VIG25_17315 [Pyrinomonadaceae bacterium]|jgi:hypothetical protein